MSSVRKLRSPLDEQPIVTLTSRQLVLAICLFFIWTLLAFIGGSVLARYELAETKGIVVVGAQQGDVGPVGGLQAGLNVLQIPAPSPPLPSSNSEAGKEVVPPHQPSQIPKETVPPKQSPPSQAPPQGPPAPQPVQKGDVQKKPPAASAGGPPAPPSPINKAPVVIVAPPSKAGSPGAAGESYGVQVAAFSAAHREQAEESRRLLESNSDLKADIVTSEDGRWVRVIVGNYPDRGTAEAERDRLKKKAGFSDCFVQKR